MPHRVDRPVIAELRERIAHLESGAGRTRAVLPFGLPEIDRKLPGGGLALGALHEVAGGGNGAVDGAAALFAAGIAARTKGKVLWIVTRADLFPPAIAQSGLVPDRMIHVEAGDEKSVLACFEEGLRHRGLGAVVAETAHLSMTASRRLQLAAEDAGTVGLARRRWRRQSEAGDFGQPTASSTRWRVSVLPSAPLPVPGLGRARWLVVLIRAKAGESADFELNSPEFRGHPRVTFPAAVRTRRVSPEIVPNYLATDDDRLVTADAIRVTRKLMAQPTLANLLVEDWTSVLGSQRLTGAPLDRLTHHVHILAMNGDSYRLKQSAGRKVAAAFDEAEQNHATA